MPSSASPSGSTSPSDPKDPRGQASFTFTDDHGVVVDYDVYPAAHPKAIIQLAHGVGEHAGRYAHAARVLNTAGYSVYINDHRGHGRTGLRQWGDPGRLGGLGPGGLRATEADLLRFAEIIRRENPGLPVILLAHSWGSLMAQRVLNGRVTVFDAVVLTGTAYRVLGSMRAGNLNGKHKHLGDTGREWLSRDVAVHHAFNADPLCFDADVLGKFGIVDTVRLLGRPAQDLPNVPLLIMAGSEDPLGGPASVQRLARAYRERSGLSDVAVRIYDGARHELFNETNKEEVFADLIAWLDAHL